MLTLAWSSDIPRFYLYEEQPREVSERFLHLESLRERSGRNDWTIQPHPPGNQCHIRGSGTTGDDLAAGGPLESTHSSPLLPRLAPAPHGNYATHALASQPTAPA